VSLVVRNYDEALDFFVSTLGFLLAEDTLVPEQAKRWVVIAPLGAMKSRLLLANVNLWDLLDRSAKQERNKMKAMKRNAVSLLLLLPLLPLGLFLLPAGWRIHFRMPERLGAALD
jgi:hypothetical protein